MGKRGTLLVARREQNKLGSVSQLALTAAMGFAVLPAFSTESWAACDPIGVNQFVCSGVNTTPQVIDSPGAQVTTMPGFSVDATTGGSGHALLIFGNGPHSYIDTNGSVLVGSSSESGLVVNSSGPDAGQVTILTNGTISGYYGILSYTDGVGAATNISAFGNVTGQAIGISASNSGFSGDISVVATTVSGQSRGIDVRNYGVGEARILATGMVEATANGIVAVTRGTDVAVTTAGVLGGDTGVIASNLGTGATSIIATGTVTGTRDYGAVAYNAPTALGGLSILTADVSGGIAGIIAANSGAGATGITAGHVSGGIGVIATNGVVDPSDFLSNPALTAIIGGANAAATDLNIAVASVNASQSGIIAKNDGTGATTITATGLVEGTGTDGIVVVNGSTATNLTVEATDVRGSSRGIAASNGGTGATRIATTGLVEGGHTGINAFNGGSAVGLTIEAAGTLGGNDGIRALNFGTGSTWIMATGAVEGTGDTGILAQNGADAGHMTIETAGVKGGRDGIVAVNEGIGVTTIMASGLVTGTTGDGVFAYNGETTPGGLSVHMADVTGGRTGIAVANSGAGATLVTAGHVNGSDGIIATNGLVSFADFFVDPFAAALTAGANGQAGDLTVEAESVTATRNGIVAANYGIGATRITTTGLVEGTGEFGIYAQNGAAATNLAIEAESVIGNDVGIGAFNSGTGATTITATDLVGGIRGEGIYAQNDAAATNISIEAESVISAETGIAAYNDGTGFTSIAASGPLTSMTGYGVFAYNGENTLGGLSVHMADVTGGRTGIAVANSGAGATLVTAGHVNGSDGIIATNGLVSFADFAADPFATALTGDANAQAGDLTVEAESVTANRNGIIAANYGIGATRITTTGLVEGTSEFGIYAQNGAAATGLTIEAESVIGDDIGIGALNLGFGATTVTANGLVHGVSGVGIFAQNDAAATNISIEAQSVIGGETGIGVYNDGTGFTDIIASGPLTSTISDGVFAYNGETTLGGLSVHTADVTGGRAGIAAANSGAGATLITAGHVNGSDGIIATNGLVSFADFFVDPFAAALTAGANGQAGDLTVEAESVTATRNGIIAANYGIGATRITTTGLVEGTGEFGIYAQNGAAATGLTIEAESVIGDDIGIGALNLGFGATTVTANGLVHGVSGVGIYAQNGAAATNIAIEAESVIGGETSIGVYNDGTGFTDIIASGPVISTISDGVFAYNGETTLGGLSVHMADVTGGRAGIAAANSGAGATLVTAGRVSASDGIIAVNGLVSFADFFVDPFAAALTAGANGQAGDLTVEAESVTATRNGIVAANYGVGATRIMTTGLVEGGAAAISAFSAGGPITIDSSGLIRNLSQLSAGAAVVGSGGPIAFTNGGGMVGTVQFGAGAHTMMNNAAWNTAGGTNEFGGGQLTNAAGIVITAAGNGGAAETTLFNGLGTFANHGALSMTDGGAGDVIRQSGGNAQFEAGSLLAVDIDGMGLSDRFTTSGTATLIGATLAVNPAGTGPAYGARYTVLTADAGLIGQFAGFTGMENTAFLTFEDAYDANNAYLDVIKYRSFASAGLTPNQIATAGGLDSMLPGPVVNAVAALATAGQARHAFDQLSGEVHVSGRTVMIEDSRFLRSAVNDRLSAAFDGVGSIATPVMAYAEGGPQYVPATTDRLAVWGQAFGSWGHWNGDGNAARLNRSIGGFFVGADAPVFDTWRFGAVAGYSRSNFDVRERASSGASDNYHVGLYGGTTWGDFSFRTGAAYTWHDITTNRSVIFPGVTESLNGRYDAATAQVFGELAYGFDAGSARFEPFANLAHVNLRSDGFTERGGASALTSSSATTDATFTTLGLRTSMTFDIGESVVIAKGMVGWRHALGNVSPDVAMRFARGSDAFSINGIAIARNAAVVEAGLDFNLSPSGALGIAYGGQFGSGTADHTFRADFGMKF